MDDTIYRQAAISAICNACGKIDCDKMDKCEKLQLPPANSSEFPNNSDTISRQAAIDEIESHSEKQILDGCISLIQEMCDYFREYLDFIDLEPEYEEEKQPFCMSYFHIVNRLFLWNTSHSGGNSTRTKCAELGIEDSSKQVLFTVWEEEEDE